MNQALPSGDNKASFHLIGLPGETSDKRCSLSLSRFFSLSLDAAAMRLRSFVTFSLRARRRRISGVRLCADIRKTPNKVKMRCGTTARVRPFRAFEF